MAATLYEESSFTANKHRPTGTGADKSWARHHKKAGDILQSACKSNGEDTETSWRWGMGIEGWQSSVNDTDKLDLWKGERPSLSP